MARHLLSFLGTTDYKETTYKYGEDTCSSKFVLHALLNTVCKDWGQQAGDKISVFITKDARADNWVDIEQKEDQKAQKGLESYLTEHFQQKKEMGELRYGVALSVNVDGDMQTYMTIDYKNLKILKENEVELFQSL